VWSAERDRGQAAALYQDPEWEGMRTRLLSGLKAIHLVCTAGVVSDEGSLKLGLSTLEEAKEISAVRFNRIQIAACAFLARAATAQRSIPVSALYTRP